MRNIRISEEVWQAIASRGKFGETEDDVLRREFGLPANSGILSAEPGVVSSPNRARYTRRRQIAGQKMSSYIDRNQIHIEFQDGSASSWELPNPKDKAGIRAVLEKALSFAREHDASLGQINTVRKTLTDAGYHLTK